MGGHALDHSFDPIPRSVDWYEESDQRRVPYEDARMNPILENRIMVRIVTMVNSDGPSQQDRWLSALGRTSSPERCCLLAGSLVKIVMRVAANLLLNREGFEVDTDEDRVLITRCSGDLR